MKTDRNKKVLLSIVIPMYNSQAFIQRCLDSLLLSKDQMSRLEVVIVDDGSKDHGTQYAEAYRQRYPNSFRIVRKSNGGHGSAVNEGVRYCTGRYLKVLDADDWMHTDSLGRLLRILEGIDAQVIACGYDRYQIGQKETPQEGGKNGRTCWEPQAENDRVCAGLSRKNQIRYLDMEQLIREWSRFRQIFCLHGMIYQTDFYKKLCYQLPEGVFYDDAFFFTVPCSHAEKLCILNMQLYVYRIGDPSQSISAENREKRIHQMEAVIRAVIRTKSRNSEKTEAGREYWYRKLVSVTADYYVTAFLRCRDRKQGRKTAQAFTRQLRQTDREVYRRIRSRYRLFAAMSVCRRSERDFERIRKWKDFLQSF